MKLDKITLWILFVVEFLGIIAIIISAAVHLYNIEELTIKNIWQWIFQVALILVVLGEASRYSSKIKIPK